MDRHIEHNLTGQSGYDRDMTDKPFLTIGEVADILQVSSRTVYIQGDAPGLQTDIPHHDHHQGGFLHDD